MFTAFIKMEIFFMNTKNSKTNESYRFKYDLIDKLDLRNPNKNMALGNLSIYYTWENVNQFIIITSLKYQHLHGMIHLTCLMDRITYQKYKIISNI